MRRKYEMQIMGLFFCKKTEILLFTREREMVWILPEEQAIKANTSRETDFGVFFLKL